VTTSEPILSRRRPQLISSERRRRWSKDDDNDEVEIPIDNDISSFNSTMISTIVEVEYPLLRQDLVEINQTDELTTISINEEITENNNTNIEQSTENIFPSTILNEIIDINTTESEILPANVTDINQVISNEKNESIIDNLKPIEIISKFYSIKFKSFFLFFALSKVMKPKHHQFQFLVIKLLKNFQQ